MSIVSVIITSFNHEKFVAKSIQSFLDQTFQEFELIIIDDSSSDNSVNIIKEFDDPRITTIFLEKNVGFCRSANIAAKKAKGEYIKFFASDDIAELNLLEKQIGFLKKNPKYEAIFSKATVIDGEDNILDKKTKRFDKYFLCKEFSNHELSRHFFFKGNCLLAPSALISRRIFEMVNGFDERMIQAHDFDLWVRLCLSGCEFYILPQRLVKYRRISNDRNLSSNTAKMRKRLIFDSHKILQRYLKITDLNYFLRIFPEYKKYDKKITIDIIPFLLAKKALEVESVYHKHFALEEIYKFLDEDKNIKIAESDFGFLINKDFSDLVENNYLGIMNEIINKKPFYRRFIKSVGQKIKSLIK